MCLIDGAGSIYCLFFVRLAINRDFLEAEWAKSRINLSNRFQFIPSVLVFALDQDGTHVKTPLKIFIG